MTLDQLNKILTERGVMEAVRYAKANGMIHHRTQDLHSSGAIRRVALHINDDGTAYICVHGTLFEGKEVSQ